MVRPFSDGGRVKRVLKLAGGLLLLAVLFVGGWIARGNYIWRKHYDAPLPPLHADTSPAAVARGASIFHVKCQACHAQPGAAHVSGRPLDDLPPFFGHFYTANITRDPGAGIGRLSDAQIARAVRYGVTHDGRRSIMGWALSDADLAAILGFMRSGDPLFDPDPTVQPQSEPSVMGAAIFGNSMGAPRMLPASGIEAPAKTDTIAYGRYCATQAYDCAFCHTAGFEPEKVDGPLAYAGGFEFKGADGASIYSRNITFHASGISGWTKAQFVKAMQDGMAPDHTILRDPMPRFRSAEQADLEAIYDFLKSLPPHEAVGPQLPRPPAPPVVAQDDTLANAAATPGAIAGQASAPAQSRAPEQLFHHVRCINCHGAKAAFHQKLVDARGKPAAELAQWIRHPEKVKPNTQMPTFANLVTEPEALALAGWIKAGNPTP